MMIVMTKITMGMMILIVMIVLNDNGEVDRKSSDGDIFSHKIWWNQIQTKALCEKDVCVYTLILLSVKLQ